MEAPNITSNATLLAMDPCLYVPDKDELRFWMVGVAGPLISILSIAENLFIALSLCSKRKNLETHFLYLICLAIADAFVSICYIPLIAMDVLKHYLKMLFIMRAWWAYFGVMLAACQVAMTASCYLILFATLERFLITSKSGLIGWARTHRLGLCLFAVLVAVVTKGPVVIEVELKQTDCGPGWTESQAAVSNITFGLIYGTIYKFYFRNVVTVFLPFTLLAYFNTSIVYTLRQQQRAARLFRFGSSDHKLKVRAATRSTVLVVCTYLVANVLNVIITGWEHIDMNSLAGQYDFYVYSTDVISLLTIIACALRLPIYWGCNREIRAVMLDTIQRHCPCVGSCVETAREDMRRTIRMTAKNTRRQPMKDNLGTSFDQVALAVGMNYKNLHPVKERLRENVSPEEEEEIELTEIEENGLLLDHMVVNASKRIYNGSIQMTI